MQATPYTLEEPVAGWELPSRGRVGMLCVILAEVTVFTIFVVAYLYYLGKSVVGPIPRDVLEPPIFYTGCLLSSSATIHFAVRGLRRGERGTFGSLWAATILLGAMFLFGTATEWHRLITVEGLTISRNLFGTTYYSLVGLHATHVIIGLFFLSVVMVFHARGRVTHENASRVDVLSIYWHFVDAVWVVVFSVVYLIGR
jgi:cytochrome c oxidase subunit 3/cytochrome o ubiquinol oxidase subunit 3